ncbi:MAG TPA: heme lyase CcmF/NrfE family subunit [Gammaproteobacteria bacterium]|jgi:cytochrome c-type biogenesis protein CcmF|nr:heme lyase CcmF/NrfE family subunit [Gammaproteobacteria bacterium]|tara:strand:+ start:3770 stop:5749 length:1980 start_codon:yes stop_codon:yes gene_type:complete
MIPELGQLLLVIAMVAAFIQSFLGMGLTKISTDQRDRLMSRIVTIHTVGLFLAMVCLGYSFVSDDFSVLYVALNSNTNLPILYKIAAIWGAHEGSFLLWLFLLSMWSFLLAFSKKHNSQYLDLKITALGILGLISFSFVLFIIFTSNPFEVLPNPPIQGRSLNPLLQDPALVIHPPMLYAGYVGLAVPFALALSSLMNSKKNHSQFHWASIARVWTIMAWVFLTGGIVLGSWWAYYELGWGGWWFWDPVENASLMPWLTTTALLHSLIVTERQKLFNGFSILLAIISFSQSLLGTFLVRSGILISVHSFASDPSRGIFILWLLGLFTGGALLLMAMKYKKEKPVKIDILSRASLLLLNNVFLCTASGLILIGTLYPLALEIFDAGKISVGAPYFNFVFLIPFLPLLFFIGLGAFTSWKFSNTKIMISKLKWILVASILFGIGCTVFFYGYAGFLTLIGIILAGWTILSGLMPLIERIIMFSTRLVMISSMNTLENAMKILPMSLAHIGLGLTVLGITVTSSYGLTQDKSLRFGQSTQVGDYIFQLNDIKESVGPNYFSIIAEIQISSKDSDITVIYPEKRIYDRNSPAMTEAGIESNIARDLFVALGENVGDQTWSLHLQYKPLLRLIWIGPFVMIIGGLFRVYLTKPLRRRKLVQQDD